MTASNSDLANQFENALTQQIDSWKTQVLQYSSTLLDGSFDDILDAVDMSGNPVTQIGKLKDLLKDTVRDEAGDALDQVKDKIQGVLDQMPSDMTSFSMHQIASLLGTAQADGKTYKGSTTLASGLTLQTTAVVETSGTTSQTLQLSLSLQSGHQRFVAKALEDRLASLGVNFEQHLEVDGQAHFDVGGSIEVHQVWKDVTDPEHEEDGQRAAGVRRRISGCHRPGCELRCESGRSRERVPVGDSSSSTRRRKLPPIMWFPTWRCASMPVPSRTVWRM